MIGRGGESAYLVLELFASFLPMLLIAELYMTLHFWQIGMTNYRKTVFY